MPFNIPNFPLYLGSVIRAIGHFIREGLSKAASIFALGPAYALVPDTEKLQAGDIAEQLVEMANKYSVLEPSDPLSMILEGAVPPGDETYINFYVKYTSTGEDTEDEFSDWRTVQWRGPWSTPRENIDDFIEQMAMELLISASDGLNPDLHPARMDIGSLIWFQHPEQS